MTLFLAAILWLIVGFITMLYISYEGRVEQYSAVDVLLSLLASPFGPFMLMILAITFVCDQLYKIKLSKD
jgi:hypothetical protein